MSKQSSRSTPPAPNGAFPHGPKEAKDAKPKDSTKSAKSAKEPRASKDPSPVTVDARTSNGLSDPAKASAHSKRNPSPTASAASASMSKDTKDTKGKPKDPKDPKDNKGPRRFRGDVEPFNPSGAYTPQMYPPQGPYPLQPFYNQQPQFVYGNQMLPYYPMMGYPDLMYQQYQFYAMANQFTPPYNQMNINGYAPRKKHGKFYPQGQNYAQSHAQGQSHGQSNPSGQYHNNWQPHGSAQGFTETSLSPHVTPPPLHSSMPSSPVPATPVSHNPTATEEVLAEPQVNPLPTTPQPENPPQELNSATSVSDSLTQASSEVVQLESLTVPDNGRLLFNLTEELIEQESKSRAAQLRQLLAIKSTCLNQHLMQNDSDFVISHDAGFYVRDHNSGNEYYKRIFSGASNGTTPNNNDPNDSSLSSQKNNLNWASFLQTTKKPLKATPSVTKNASGLDSVPDSSISEDAATHPVAFEPAVDQSPQSLGLLTAKMLFDPYFDFELCDAFDVKPRGLTNSGNICYMNAVLQCLILCEPFNKLLRLVEEKSIGSLGKNSPHPLIDAAISFFVDFVTVPTSSKPNTSLVNSEGIVVGKPLSPENLYMRLIENPKFKHLKWGQQEDAEEFLGYLLDGLHEEFVKAEATVSVDEMEMLFSRYSQSLDSLLAEELKARMKNAARLVRSTERKHVEDTEEVESDNSGWSEVGSGKRVNKKRVMEVEPSPITSIFGGNFRSVLIVPKAKEAQSITIDPYRCILLDISHKETETIEDALKRFTEVEEIPFKSEGGKEVIARKQSFIENLPDILILQLKRFSFEQQQLPDFVADKKDIETDISNSHQMGTIEKVMKNIRYELDLTVPLECLSSAARQSGTRNYHLVGVIYHHGRNAEGGHYTCDVLRSKTDNKWLRIDDTAVETVTAEAVVGKPAARDKSAYILMYQRL